MNARAPAARITRVPATEPARWEAALEGLPAAFGHGAAAMAALAQPTRARALLWRCDDDARGTAAACAVLLQEDATGRDLATAPGFAGWIANGPVPALADAWTGDWRDHGALAAYTQAAPWTPADWLERDWPEAAAWTAGADSLEWDLAPAPDALLAGMAPKHRQLLRKWQRAEPAIAWDAAELAPAFARLYAEFLARTSVAPAYRFDADSLAALGSAPGALFVGVRGAGGAIEAAMLFGARGERGDSLLAAATPEGRGHARGLYWLGALRLREAGVRRLNLGGGVAADDGIAGFKARLGARVAPSRVLRQVFDRAGFADACARAGVSPDARWFPPWRLPRD